MAQTLHNNVFTKLAASLSNSATSISLLDGSDFPTPAVGDFYFATLVSISGSTGKEDDWEIVKVTGKPATNTLTVTRGQEGTAARAWDTYTPCEIRITAGTVVMPDGTQNLSNKTITSSTLDDSVIGGTTAAAGSFTDLDATTVEATNVEVTNIKANDGTAAGSIADSTGVVSLNSAVLTTADINGGTVDGATIGQTTPALGTFTDMVADELQLTGGSGDQGKFSWNSDEDTVALVISSGESLQLGQEVEYNVRNNSGSSIAKGVPVMITGTIGSSGRITIGEMDATSVANDKKYLGITAEAIGSGADGKVMFFGKVSGLDTSSYSDGDLLFLDTSVVGGLTATEPNSGIKLGAAYVVHSHASAGVLMVRPSASVGLHDLHDVFVDAPGTGEIIRYNATNGLWETKTLAEADIATVTYVDSQITSNDELSEILATGNTTGGTDISVGTGDDITFADSSKAIFGAGSDLEIYHDGSGSYVSDTGTGPLRLQGSGVRITGTSGENLLIASAGAEVTLLHNNAAKLATTSTGIDVTGDVNSDSVTTGTFTSTGIDDNATSTAITIDSSQDVTFTSDAIFPDNGKAIFGAGSDLQIYHNGSNSVVRETGAGSLYLGTNNQIVMYDTNNGEELAVFNRDGDVQLNYNNATKLATTSTGIDVTGNVTIDSAIYRTDTGAGGIRFATAGNIRPVNTAGTSTDLALDIGDPSFRFNDLHLGGDAFVAGNVGIGVTDPARKLEIGDGTEASIRLRNTDSSLGLNQIIGRLEWEKDDASGGGAGVCAEIAVHSAGSSGDSVYMAFHTSSSTTLNREVVRIDGGGNLLVGRTSVSNGTTTVGHLLNADGVAVHARDADTPLRVSRLTDDGEIISFHQDGTTVGSIGTKSSGMYIGTDDAGIFFNHHGGGNLDAIFPYDLSTNSFYNGQMNVGGPSNQFGAGYFNYTTVDNGAVYNNFSGASGVSFSGTGTTPCDNTGTLSDGSHDLGRANGRFKDLYLSGGAYLGGIVSANYLDDYEEGTWTPVANNLTLNYSGVTSSGSYVKIGKLVTATFAIQWTTANVGAGYAALNLPLLSSTDYGSGILIEVDQASVNIDQLSMYTTASQSLIYFRKRNAGGSSFICARTDLFVSGSNRISGTITYYAS